MNKIFVIAQWMDYKYTYLDVDSIFSNYHKEIKDTKAEFRISPKCAGSMFQAILELDQDPEEIFSDLMNMYNMLICWSEGDMTDDHTNPLTNSSEGFLELGRSFDMLKNKNKTGIYCISDK
jgi:hypothetical protein